MVLLPATLILNSCVHYYYVPNVHNVPLFREKDEINVSGNLGLGYESISAEIQSAYSITDNIAIMANYMGAKGGHRSFSQGKGNYFEAAAGFFKPIQKYRTFEIYAGAGGSRQHHIYDAKDLDPSSPQYDSGGGTSKLSYLKFFVQPSYGWTFKCIDIAFSTRFCSLNYLHIQNLINPGANLYDFRKLQSIEKDRNYLFFEPALTLRLKIENLSLQLQGSAESYTNNRKNHFDEYHLSIGLCGSF